MLLIDELKMTDYQKPYTVKLNLHLYSSPRVECFKALPDDTIEVIKSSASVIRRTAKEQKELPIEVVKCLRFIDVPPPIAENLSLSSTRQIFNHNTRCMIIKLLTRAYEVASRSLVIEVIYVVRDIGLYRSISIVGSYSVRDSPYITCYRSRYKMADRYGRS
ncbi:hypothetical protein N7537_001889 [Penicillium hordei]|uniref:Uncharacterized protein n=1 Tax=Penicillium hordei TaxID=40994 RepID=A0AAD6EGE7_9EURO|nr:uncharacterized protein N7537_001889 [Penicillium hordei]KAJ5616775.1 hypothetical protein N7537_001889 [Penicillium hordei]